MSTCIEIYTPKANPYTAIAGNAPLANPYAAIAGYTPLLPNPYLPFCFTVAGYLFQDGSNKLFMDGTVFEFN